MEQASARLPLAPPRATYALLAINVAVWLIMTATGYLRGLGLDGTQTTSVLLAFGAQQNLYVAQGDYWRLFTSMFIHIGLVHLLFNSYALYVLGRDVESLYGTGRFLMVYLLSGLGGGVLFYVVGYFLNDATPSAGASGAIFGLIGAEAAYFYLHRRMFGQRGKQNLTNLLGVIAVNLVIGFTVPGINNLAHIGGLLTGALLGWLLAPRYAWPAWPSSSQDAFLEDRTTAPRRLVVLTAALLALALLGIVGTWLWNNSTSARLEQAVQLLDSGDNAAAAAILRPLATAEPEDGNVQFYAGLAEANLGNLDAARQAWERSAALRPEVAGIHWNLALVYRDLSRPADAIAALRTYVQLVDSAEEKAQAEALIREFSSGIDD
jgi:rhomboid protease GluP